VKLMKPRKLLRARRPLAAARRLAATLLHLVERWAAGWRRRHPALARHYPLADAAADCWLGLLRAAQLFDCRRQVRFKSYAYFWARTKMNRGAREAMPDMFPLSSFHTSLGSDWSDIPVEPSLSDAEVLEREQDIVEAVRLAMNRLRNRRHRRILEERLAGHSLREVASTIRMCCETVRIDEQEAHVELRQLLAPWQQELRDKKRSKHGRQG
jgi:RNA polymerase sigma factor (sigma-70 family)